VNSVQFILVGAIKVYQRVLAPVLGAALAPMGFGCRFHPTCSVYASQALREHGAVKGTWFALRRLCRCHPWGGSGLDPVPDRKTF
jgi:uncharacterized protein